MTAEQFNNNQATRPQPEKGEKMTSLVSERALQKRINRQLAKENERLVKSKGLKAKTELGEWYIINGINNILAWHCEIEKLGREIGVFKPSESLA